jgi:hypothetical protein
MGGITTEIHTIEGLARGMRLSKQLAAKLTIEVIYPNPNYWKNSSGSKRISGKSLGR